MHWFEKNICSGVSQQLGFKSKMLLMPCMLIIFDRLLTNKQCTFNTLEHALNHPGINVFGAFNLNKIAFLSKYVSTIFKLKGTLKEK